MAIYLIRHGETAGNRHRVVQVPETPLSPRGLEQAERLGRRLARAGIARIVSSDLARAAMTAERLRAATGAPLALDPLLQERNFGDVRGTPYAELGTDLFGPDYAPPNGETWADLHARVDEAWRRVRAAAAETPGHLAVVTHGLVCYSLALRILQLPGETKATMAFGNTSVTIADPDPPHRVRLLNCTSHLGNPAGGPGPAAVVQ